MIPSNRTLEAGSRQVKPDTFELDTFEQCPLAEDPFTDVVPFGNVNSDGIC